MHSILLTLAWPDFTSPAIWMSLLTLTFLEIILGVDNIIFISIVSNRLPESQQAQGRTIGLMLAMVFRSLLLLSITWIISLTKPLFYLPWVEAATGANMAISARDLILFGGGVFLLYKSVMEIHHKMEGEDENPAGKSTGRSNFFSILIQIVLVDLVFSFDSILTAIGLSNQVVIMIIAVVVSIFIMMQFAGWISHFVNKNPGIQMLALSFLILIGVMLVMEGLHQHVEKSYIYAAIAFSLGVELLNMRRGKKIAKKTVKLHNELLEQAVEEGAMLDDKTFSALDPNEKR
jgi:predicted tellurium resistance membrane protein TerC